MDVSSPQRQHPRYAHEATIALHTPDQAIFGRTSNVSRGGLCATLSEHIALGTDVALDIQLVFDDDHQSEPLRLPARIVWCTSLGDRHQVGVQFLSLDAEAADYLTMFLRYLDNGGGARPRKPAVSVDDRFR